jgi:putative membrane fusion protein
MKTKTVTFVIILVCVLVLVTFINQLLLFLRTDYKTETAVSISSTEVVRITGIYVRDEKVLPLDGIYANDVLKYTVTDGGKVAADSIIAEVYDSRFDIETSNQIADIDEEIAILREQQNPGATSIAQPEFISSLIGSAYQSVLIANSSDDLSLLPEARTELRTLMGIYSIVTKSETGFDSKIEELLAQRDTLKSQLHPPVGTIYSGDSGYFISYTDGFENILTPETVSSLTIERIDSVIDGFGASFMGVPTVGKLVSGYNWQMVGVVNPASADFKTGAKVLLELPEKDVSVTAAVDMVLETPDPDKRIIVLSCSEFRTQFASSRTDTADIVLNDYTGIRIPRSAIRFNAANEKGVYILQGERVSFKKIDVIFESTDYVISASPDSSFVALYDDIITAGVDTAAANAVELITEASTGEDILT